MSRERVPSMFVAVYLFLIARLPDVNPHTHLRLERTVPLRTTGDNPLYICVTQEDGHLAWSSPLYVFHEPWGRGR